MKERRIDCFKATLTSFASGKNVYVSYCCCNRLLECTGLKQHTILFSVS